jgi:hypothetical protein
MWEVLRNSHHFPFQTLLAALKNTEQAELTFHMRCVTHQTKCVNNPGEKHTEIREKSSNNL